MLEKFGPEIWIASGINVAVMGFQYPTRMAIIRLSDKTLFIWSPIALTEELRTEVNALGKVCHIVAPNSLHHLFINDWKQAYPTAKLYAAPRLREKRKDISFDNDLGNQPPLEWETNLSQVMMNGNLITTEIVFFHIQSKTVLFVDLVQNFPTGWFSGWRALIAKLDLLTAATPSVPRKFQLAFTNRQTARVSLAKILKWPCKNILMAHGTPIKQNGDMFIEKAFRWLTKQPKR